MAIYSHNLFKYKLVRKSALTSSRWPVDHPGREVSGVPDGCIQMDTENIPKKSCS